ncbi:MAG: ATP-binding cassette domain-containing protein [Candidatus Saganbacteria bacterium]|nr:ATP-binding cassette domain-containing protein [Candidatus Saganbacteria bacterium]
MENPKLIIEIEQVSKNFKRIPALSNLFLQIKSGEIFGLIGPDGAGKSTLAHIIAGILRPDKGIVTVIGKDVLKAPESIKSEIGFLPQGLGLALAQELSVEENINYFAEINQVDPKKREERKTLLLNKTQLGAFRNRPAKNLSGGMQQKLALCCTLIHQPKLLLLDEPTTGVDPISRRDLWLIINDMVEESGVTVLLTTSYMDEAARCHRVALMHNGTILELGEPNDLLSKLKTSTSSHPKIEELFLTHLSDPKKDAINQKALAEFFQNEEKSSQDKDQIVIKAKMLEKKFQEFTAVNKISFGIKQGEIFGFLGPNGAGKTTTIKMLCGLLQPTGGCGTVSGFDLSCEVSAIKKSIGYMSQRFSLYGNLTVSENIELYGSIYEVSRTEVLKRRKLLLQITDLEGREDAITADLPLGIKQRLALGCAIIHKPKVLFLDEPTSGVDPIARRKFWDTILLLSRQMGVTILVSTHHLDEAEYCDRIILINQGSITATGSAEELRKKAQEEMGTLIEISTDNLPFSFQLLKDHFPLCFEYGAHVHIYTKDVDLDIQKAKNILLEKGIALTNIGEQVIPFENVFTHFCETMKETS